MSVESSSWDARGVSESKSRPKCHDGHLGTVEVGDADPERSLGQVRQALEPRPRRQRVQRRQQCRAGVPDVGRGRVSLLTDYDTRHTLVTDQIMTLVTLNCTSQPPRAW